MNKSGPFDLQNRTALVTGAGQGVGRAIAISLAKNGAGAIAVNDVDAERAESVAAEIQAMGVQAAAIVADVTDLDAVRRGVATATDRFGAISILVNNAGNAGAAVFPQLRYFWETDPDQWRRFIDVNLYGVMNCCHAVLPAMIERRYGRVVTIISDSSRNIEPRLSDYAAAKAGAAGFTRGLAADAAAFGITANCISIASLLPGMAPDELKEFLASDRSRRQLSKYAIRRYGRVEDIVGTVLLLCSDASAWTTGQTYPVNGGYSPSL